MNQATADRTVVCDDDSVLRGVVRRMLEDLGYLVVAEVADPEAAADAVVRTGAGLLVLDLALQWGRGEDILARVAAAECPPRIVVFSSYVGSHDVLLRDGATVVVEKPDFLHLERVLRSLRSEVPASERRRRLSRPAPVMPTQTSATAGGFEPWRSFCDALDCMSAGDALLALDVVPPVDQRELWDHVHRHDHRVELGRLAIVGRRIGERASLSPRGLPVVALVGGHPEAPTAVFTRLEQSWASTGAAGVPVGAFGHVAAEQPPARVLEGVLDALASGADVDHPLRMI